MKKVEQVVTELKNNLELFKGEVRIDKDLSILSQRTLNETCSNIQISQSHLEARLIGQISYVRGITDALCEKISELEKRIIELE